MKDILKNYYVNEMIGIINESNGKEIIPLSATVSDKLNAILSNISLLKKSETYLAEDGQEVKKEWIPLNYKRLLFHLLNDNEVRIDTSVVKFESGKMVQASTDLFQILENGQEIKVSHSEGICVSSQVGNRFNDLSPAEIDQCMVSYAEASSERKALYRAGLFMDYEGDIYLPSGDEDDMPAASTTENTQFNADVANKLSEAINKEKEDTVDLSVVVYGPMKDKPISEASPKYIAWLINQAECKKYDCAEVYMNMLLEKKKNNPVIQRLYEAGKKS